jgi:hypothetical protein
MRIRYCKLLHAKSCQQRTSGQTHFDDLAVGAVKLPDTHSLP